MKLVDGNRSKKEVKPVEKTTAIVNLLSRKMMGIDSCGMLISAVHEEDGKEGLNLFMVDDCIYAGVKL